MDASHPDSQVTVITLIKVNAKLCATCGGVIDPDATCCCHCQAIDTTT